MESFSGWFEASPKHFIRDLLFLLVGLTATAEYLVSRMKRRTVHESGDVWVNLTMYFGYIPIYAGLIYLAMPFMTEFWTRYSLVPMGKSWWRGEMSLLEWAALFLLVDLAYYVYHYVCHHSRFFWATHIGHHSSRYFNITTGIRQPWVPLFPLFFWLPIVWVGFYPPLVVLMASINLNFQILIHTQLVRSFGPLDLIFNSPSHHRVHHACNPIYRDKNLGGILIIWDRIFGTFAREIEKPEFGIGANRDFGVIENSFGEFKRIWAGARAYPDSFAKLSYLLKRPDSTDSPEQEALREFS